VAVEKLRNKKLASKPLIVAGSGGRHAVIACSEEAARVGVHAGMPVHQALELCPQAAIAAGDMDVYTRYSRIVTEVIASRAVVVEKLSLDEHLIDITEMGDFSEGLKWTRDLQQYISNETGLSVSFGLGANRTVAEIACSMAGAGGQYCVLPGTEKAVMALLPVRKIPGIDTKMVQLLRNMGIDRMQGLQQMSEAAVGKLLGAQGLAVWHKANGIDDTAVAAMQVQRTAIAAEISYENAITDKNQLRKSIITMTDKLVAELRREQRLASCVALEVQTGQGRRTVQVKLSPTASGAVLAEKALELLARVGTGMAMKYMNLQLGNLTQGAYQIDMFNDTLTQINLHKAQDRIRVKYLHNAVRA
jgi:DNA polymerase-4